MNLLDDIKKANKIDKSDVYGSIEQLAQQCVHTYGDAEGIKAPKEYSDVKAIVMAGMGGSGLGARVIESVYGNQMSVPIHRLHDYNLPSWADEDTLVICSSFSGTTEEVVHVANQAIDKKCKWMAIGTGGVLISLAEKHKAPFYKMIPTYNPSKEPRMAIGYSVFGQLMLVRSASLINFEKEDLDKAKEAMEMVVEKNNIEVPLKLNPAKKLSKKFHEKIVVFVGAEHMVGAIHAVKNQMNENCKNMNVAHYIPELNHHLMEGLAHPRNNADTLVFMFIESDLYSKRISQRMEITKRVVKKHGIPLFSWKPRSEDKLSQVFEYIQFGALTNYYLVMLYGIDPASIPWVDYFKKQLGQSLGAWK